MTKTQRDELINRFTSHALREGQSEKYEQIRSKALSLAIFICKSCPDSREASLAITHLEQAMFFANAAIARRE